MAASIFSDTTLLEAHRAGMRERGAGPRAPVTLLTAYLRSEKTSGRLPASLDADAIARLLTGAVLLEAFLANYDGREPSGAPAMITGLVEAVLPRSGGTPRA